MLLQCVGSLEAATFWASSPSYADVSAKVSLASDGDTVLIPHGSATWNDRLFVNKAITIAGAAAYYGWPVAGNEFTTTTIYGGGTSPFALIGFYFDAPENRPIRVSGISFDNSSVPTVGSIAIYANYGRSITDPDNPDVDTPYPITAFRVDHCNFSYSAAAVNPQGWAYGLVDHCLFVNCDTAVRITGDDDDAWSRPVEPGSANCVCVEDNSFVVDGNATTTPNEQVYHQQGTRSIIRHNQFDGLSYIPPLGQSPLCFIDAHGNNNLYHGHKFDDPAHGVVADFRGTVLLECYGNVFGAQNPSRMTYLRGGTLFCYDNYMYSETTTANAFELTEEEGWQTAIENPVDTTWPAQDQVANSYFWGNWIGNESAEFTTIIGLNHPSDSTFIQEGRDYWMHEPQLGQTYYPYTPLIYPHPLARRDPPADDDWAFGDYGYEGSGCGLFIGWYTGHTWSITHGLLPAPRLEISVRVNSGEWGNNGSNFMYSDVEGGYCDAYYGDYVEGQARYTEVDGTPLSDWSNPKSFIISY